MNGYITIFDRDGKYTHTSSLDKTLPCIEYDHSIQWIRYHFQNESNEFNFFPSDIDWKGYLVVQQIASVDKETKRIKFTGKPTLILPKQ